MVEFVSVTGATVKNLDPPNVAAVLSSDRHINAIRVTFTDKVDPATATTGGFGANPQTFSFLVQGGGLAIGFVPGKIVVESPNVVRFVIDDQLREFRRGDYAGRIFGDPKPADGRPAIAEPGGGSHLDGERNPTYPSGDGTQGGVFDFKFVVQ